MEFIRPITMAPGTSPSLLQPPHHRDPPSHVTSQTGIVHGTKAPALQQDPEDDDFEEIELR